MKALKIMAFSGILAAASLMAHGEENTLISFTLSTTSSTKIALNGTGEVTVKKQGADSGTTVTIGSGTATEVTITPETADETWVITAEDGVGVTSFTKKCDVESGGETLPDSNPITAIDVTGDPALTSLTLKFQQAIETLDLTKNTELVSLFLQYNKLKELDLSQCTKLRQIDVGNNLLESLDVSKCPQIYSLICNENKLTRLDVSMLTELTQLIVSQNDIKELDVANCTKMHDINISETLIEKVDLSGATGLQQFMAEFAELKSIDLSNNVDVTFYIVEGNQLAFHTIKWSETRPTVLATNGIYPFYFITCMQRKITVPYNELYVDLSEYMQPVTFSGTTYPTTLNGFYVYDSTTLGTVEDYPYGPWYAPSPFGTDTAREGVKLDSGFYISFKDYKEANSTAYEATYGAFEQTDLDKKFNISDQIFNVYDTDGDKKVTLYASLSNELFNASADFLGLPLTLYTVPMEFSHPTPTGVENVSLDEAEIEAVYDLQGRLRDGVQPGVNIVRYTDGSVKKLKK